MQRVLKLYVVFPTYMRVIRFILPILLSVLPYFYINAENLIDDSAYCVTVYQRDGESVKCLVSSELAFYFVGGCLHFENEDGLNSFTLTDVVKIDYDYSTKIPTNGINSVEDKALFEFKSNSLTIRTVKSGNYLRILNLEGSVLDQMDFSESAIIDFSAYQQGIYIVNVNNIQTIKIQIQ